MEKEINNERQTALLNFLGLGEAGEDDLGIETSSFDDNAFTVDGGEYLVLTDEEADEKAAEYIKDSLWAFTPDFIIDNSPLPYEAREMIEAFCADKCEGANDTITAIVGEDIDTFIECAIASDGRGHFLARYDGNEGEEGEFYIYRIS